MHLGMGSFTPSSPAPAAPRYAASGLDRVLVPMPWRGRSGTPSPKPMPSAYQPFRLCLGATARGNDNHQFGSIPE